MEDDMKMVKTIFEIKDGVHDSVLNAVMSNEHILKAKTEFGVHVSSSLFSYPLGSICSNERMPLL